MLIKNMEYLSHSLRCTDGEKDACLETVTAILHFWTDVRKNGVLAIGGDRAEHDSNPFFRACLLDAIEFMGSEDEPLLEELFAQYLIAGDYTGGPFLQNVVIAEGILAYLKFLHEHEDGGSFQQWGDRLPAVVGGYFGVEYREKLRKTIRREIRKREREVTKTSCLPEFDALAEFPLPLCEKLLRDAYDDHYAFGDRTLALALNHASGAVQDHVLSVLPPRKNGRRWRRRWTLVSSCGRQTWNTPSGKFWIESLAMNRQKEEREYVHLQKRGIPGRNETGGHFPHGAFEAGYPDHPEF